MIKLLKHEFKKEFARLVALLIILGISQVIGLVGIYNHSKNLMSAGFNIFGLVMVYGCIGIGLDSILTMINDLSNNHNYMLFMTPNNGFKILGAKVLENLISTLGFIVICAFMIVGDYFLMGGVHQNEITFHLKFFPAVHYFFYGLMVWLSIVALITLAIVLSATLFRDSHHNFLLSLIVFIVLSILMGIIHSTIGNSIPDSEYNIYNLIYTIVMILGSYIGAALLMDHQLSL